jgi:Integrase zinc binding domain
VSKKKEIITICFSITKMPTKQSNILISTIDVSARDQFYEHAKRHIDLLNPKFRNKAVVTRVLSEKIINALQNKISPEKNYGVFTRWCRRSFVLRPIGGHHLLCDTKNMKPVLLFEDMYEVYFNSHQQTAHSGRDKCLDHIATNYSWSNRSLLQIFLKQCSVCQTRKSVKFPSVSKPIIALGISSFSR